MDATEAVNLRELSNKVKVLVGTSDKIETIQKRAMVPFKAEVI